MMKKVVRVQSNRVAYYIYIPRAYAKSMALELGDLMLAEVQPDGALLLRPLEVRVREAIPVEKKGETWPPVAGAGGPLGGGLRREERGARI